MDDLQAEGVNISARYDVEFSNFEAYDDNPEHIRISLKNVKVPLNVLWILFHEFGHFQSPKIRLGDNKVAREELAWEFAEKTIANIRSLPQKKKVMKPVKSGA